MIETMKKIFGKKLMIFLCICSFSTVLLYRKLFMEINANNKEHILRDDSVPQEMSTWPTCPKMYFQNGIDNLVENIHILNIVTNAACASLSEKFSVMYEVDMFNASQKFGTEFSKKMRSWLGNVSSLMDTSKLQTVIAVHDILRQRTTVFNPLRSKRPLSSTQKSVKTFLKNITQISKENCDFCRPLKMTAEDVFGRIQGKYSMTASNAFKLGKWHGLFIPFEHSMFDVDISIMLDMFNTSIKWFKKVHSIDRDAKYPVFFWDAFPHAGASQTHVHAQGIAGVDHYPGQFHDLLRTVHVFKETHGAHYWDALVEIHESLGLSLRFGKVIVIAPLVPQREHELWLFSNEPSTEFFELLYYIISMYQEVLEKFCFSMAGALPALGEKLTDPELSLPSIAIIGTRGDCSSPVNDVSSLELYLFNNVNTDPYITIRTLHKYLATSTTKYQIDEEMENLWT